LIGNLVGKETFREGKENILLISIFYYHRSLFFRKEKPSGKRN